MKALPTEYSPRFGFDFRSHVQNAFHFVSGSDAKVLRNYDGTGSTAVTAVLEGCMAVLLLCSCFARVQRLT